MLAILFIARVTMGFQYQAVAALSPLFADSFGIGLADLGILVGLVIAVYRLMGIKVSDYKTSHNRPYYLCPLYENYIDFLNGKDTNLISKNIDWGDWWYKKSTTRYKKLDKDNQLASEILFHERIPEDEIEMWLSVAGKT